MSIPQGKRRDQSNRFRARRPFQGKTDRMSADYMNPYDGAEARRSGRGITVIYILGQGHSGSTLLTVLLGGADDAFGAGELFQWPSRPWQGNRTHCSCGAIDSECPVWKPIFEQWVSDAGLDFLRYSAMERRLIRLSIHRIVLDYLGLVDWTGNANFATYAPQTLALYQSIADTTGKSVIIDSSKNLVRAVILSRIKEIDLKVIHLVRDPRAVAWSYIKKAGSSRKAVGSKSVARLSVSARIAIASKWLLSNACAEVLLGDARFQAIRVRYEDLVVNPRDTLSSIQKFTGVDLRPSIDRAAAGHSLKMGHIVAGNRMRRSKVVAIRPDWEWQENLPMFDRVLSRVLSSGLRTRYGYTKVGKGLKRL